MTIMDKYFGWKDIFFDRFVHCCNEKSGQPQGSNIPLAKINFDNKTGYVEDGTINIAELLQYLWINNKVYGCEYAPIDISSALQTLIIRQVIIVGLPRNTANCRRIGQA